MKSIVLSSLLIFLSSCAIADDKPTKTTEPVSWHLSPNYHIELPLPMFSGAKILGTEHTSLRFKDGSSLSVEIISNQDGSLFDEKNVDLHKYPRLLFGLEKPSSEDFQVDLNEVQYRLKNTETSTYSSNGLDFYHSCTDTDCGTYIVKQSIKDEILLLSSHGLSLNSVKKLVKGVK
jgi:hypothetical protein